MSCNHKWVDYQPFQGEAYKCCANAGCGIRYETWYDGIKKQQEAYENDFWDKLGKTVTLPTLDWLSQPKQDKTVKWEPCELSDYMDYNRYVDGSVYGTKK